jgi:hypothetical protein
MKSKPKVPQVSLRGETYAKIKEHCEREGISPGRFVDELCRAFLEGREPRKDPDDGNGRLFTDEELQKLRTR